MFTNNFCVFVIAAGMYKKWTIVLNTLYLQSSNDLWQMQKNLFHFNENFFEIFLTLNTSPQQTLFDNYKEAI